MPGKKVLALAFFAVFTVLYFLTLCQGTYTMDSGELIICAYRLQIPHATGYPLFCLLGKAFTYLVPVGSIAWRVNAMNALFAAAAVSVLFLALCEVIRRRGAAIFAAVMFGVTPVFWDAATSAEVHSLNILFISTLLLLFLRWRNLNDNKLLLYMALTAGLCLTNHLSSALIMPALLYGVLRHNSSVIRNRSFVLKAIILFLLPLSLYVYLPLREETSRGTVWGDIYAATGFTSHVTGKIFKGLMFKCGLSGAWKNFIYFLNLMVTQFPVYLAWLIPVGGILINRRRCGLLAVLGAAMVINILYSVNYSIVDIETYYLPTMLALSVFTAVGVECILEQRESSKLHRVAFGAMCVALVVVTAVRYPQMDKRQLFYIEDYTRNALMTIEKDALFIGCGDAPYNAIRYAREVEGKRNDIILLQRQILRGWPPQFNFWPGKCYFESFAKQSESLQKFKVANNYSRRKIRNEKLLEDVINTVIKERPVYFSCGSKHSNTHPIISRLEKNYELIPDGLVYRIYPKSQKIDYAALAKRNEKLWQTYKIRDIYVDWSEAGLLEAEIPDRYCTAHVALAEMELKARMYKQAAANFEKALVINYKLNRARNGLGVALACQGKYEEAARQWSMVLELDPKNKTALRSIRMTQRPGKAVMSDEQ